MKFSLRFNNDLPVQDYVSLAQAAERAGFDQFWVSNDLFLRSAPVILTAVAGATERIEIGTCILNPYTIDPSEIAMFAATLDEYSGGRFNLGLASGAADFLAWVGYQHDKPRTSLIEVVRAINALMCGETASIDGHFLNWSAEAYLRFEPKRRVPIYLGAMSKIMIRAIGEVADGGLPLMLPPEHFRNVQPLVAEGATQAGRSMDEIDLAGCIWCSLDSDPAAARDALAEKVAYYGHAFSPLILSQLGLTHADFTEIEHAVQTENDIARAKSLVTDQMLGIGVMGNPRDLIERLESLVDLGMYHISFGPPLGPLPLAAIEQLGSDVILHFRGRS